ncbi:hypothetical protein BX616_004843, partial [Lobosporangium transversale]
AQMFTEQMLGQIKQTGAAGKVCNAVWICEQQVRSLCDFAILVGRKPQGSMMVASFQDGVDLKSVPAEDSEATSQQLVDINEETNCVAHDLAEYMVFSPKCTDQATD